ncbi:MAG: O-antigen ligase family protein [Flavobacteriales bacterium]
MIRLLQKYGAYAFLLNNLLFSVSGYYGLATNIFLILLAVFSFFTIFNSAFIKNAILDKSFNFYFLIILLNILYFVLIEINDFESFKFLLAKTVQLILFTSTIYFTYDKFKSNFLMFLKVITLSSLFLSLVSSLPTLDSRYLGIFYNPNELSIIMVYGFALFLFNYKKSFYNILIAICFLFVILATGSRSALLAVFLALIIRFSLIKFLLISLIGAFISLTIFSNIQTIDRLVSEQLFFNRKYEILYALETLSNSLWFGYGLKNYAYIDKNLINFTDVSIDFGAHNAYLSTLVQYGVIFGAIYFSIMFRTLFKSLIHLKNRIKFNSDYRMLLFIVVYTMINGFFENSFNGINFFQSSLFWLTLGFLYYDSKVIKTSL